jgi:hypothetical protein
VWGMELSCQQLAIRTPSLFSREVFCCSVDGWTVHPLTQSKSPRTTLRTPADDMEANSTNSDGLTSSSNFYTIDRCRNPHIEAHLSKWSALSGDLQKALYNLRNEQQVFEDA